MLGKIFALKKQHKPDVFSFLITTKKYYNQTIKTCYTFFFIFSSLT